MTDLIETEFRSLSRQLPGRVSLPGDKRYVETTSIWAKPTKRMPRAVVHCRSTGDVQAAIRAARDRGVALSVRGGGHDWAGRALCDGVVIDLRDMNGIIADADLTVQIAGGARASDVAAVADPLGLVAVTGSAGVVGMTGMTLGGGYGPLIGRFGLALDNMLGAEVVLADGRVVFTSPKAEKELFWALRGGGGNFGVVTSMVHRLHNVPSVHSGMLIYRFAEAKAVLERCVDIAASMPDECTVQIVIAASPDGTPVVLIVPTWCGEPTQGEAQVAPFLKMGTLLASTVERKPYGAALATFDGHIVNGRRTFMETCWLPAFGSGSIDAFIHAMASAPSSGCAMVTHEFKGAASRVATDATAFPLRRDHVLVEIIASCPGDSDEIEEERHRRWARATRDAFGAVAIPGGYPNLLAEGDTERAAQSYGANAEWLLKAERRYDPDKVFSSAIPLPFRG
jgi:hypothetical protein